MTRAVYVMRDGELVEKHLAAPHPRAGHYLISDVLPDVLCPSDGKHYSSKSAFYRAVRANGGEIMGNDTSLRERPKPNIEPVQRTMQRLYEQKGWE